MNKPRFVRNDVIQKGTEATKPTRNCFLFLVCNLRAFTVVERYEAYLSFFQLRHHHFAHLAASYHLHHLASLVKLFQQTVHLLDVCTATLGDALAA